MDQTRTELGKQRDNALLTAAGAAVLSRMITIATTVVSLGIAAAQLSRPEFGVVAVLTTLTVFLGFADFGLGSLLLSRLPAAHARGDVDESRRIVMVTLSTLCWVGGALVTVGGASSAVLPWRSLLGAEQLPAGGVRAAVACLFVFGALAIPTTVGSRVLAAMQRSALLHLWNAAAGIVSLALTAVCAAVGAPIWAYVAALAGGPALVSGVQTVWVLTRAFPALRPHTLRARWADVAEFLRASSLFAVMSLSAVIAYAIDSLVVSSILGASAAAVFSVASRLFALVGSTLSLAGQQLWSALSDAITRGDAGWARSRFRRTVVVSVSINVVACLVLVAAGRQLIRIWVGTALVPPLSLLIVLAIYTVYSTTVTQASYLLAAVEQVRSVAAAGVVMAVVNLAVSIELTRVYGLTGPILGSIVALLLVLSAPIVVLTRRQLRQLDARVTPVSGAAARVTTTEP